MQKSILSLSLVAALALLLPTANAEQTGCNPHPQPNVATSAPLRTLTTVLMGYFGL